MGDEATAAKIAEKLKSTTSLRAQTGNPTPSDLNRFLQNAEEKKEKFQTYLTRSGISAAIVKVCCCSPRLTLHVR